MWLEIGSEQLSLLIWIMDTYWKYGRSFLLSLGRKYAESYTQIENCLFSNNAGELRKAYHLERVLKGSEDWIFAMDLDETERVLCDKQRIAEERMGGY